MKTAVLISSLYNQDGPESGTFELFFRNLSAGLNLDSEKLGWKAHVVPKAARRRRHKVVKDVFKAPAFLGGNLRTSLAGFGQRLDAKAFIDAYAKKLAEHADVICSADIVHAHDPFAILAFHKVRRLNKAVNLCFTPGLLSCLRTGEAERPWLKSLEAEALDMAAFLMGPSREYSAAVDRAYCPLKKPYIILPGLDDEKYLRTGVLRQKLRCPESALLICAFYGPGSEAAAELFMDACALARTITGGRLFGAVSGLKTPELENKIKALGLESFFTLIEPAVGRGELLAEADIFFSSLRGQTLDLGDIEALRAGLAVVASDDCWNAEAAGYGEAAMLFKAGDAAAAGAALADIVLHPAALIHFSSKARDYFRAQYTLGAFAARAAKAYEDMLKNNS